MSSKPRLESSQIDINIDLVLVYRFAGDLLLSLQSVVGSRRPQATVYVSAPVCFDNDTIVIMDLKEED